MPLLNSTSASSEQKPSVESLVKLGYKIVSDGQSGVQLEKKSMRSLDKFAVALGAVLLFFAWPVSLILWVVALLDYAFFTKRDTVFVARS